MERIFGKPLITQQSIQRRIKELGVKISDDYEGREILLVGILKGAYTFFADLSRAIQVPVRIDFMLVSSYGPRARTSGVVKTISDLTAEVKGRDVLLVEDIVDSGLTLGFLLKKLRTKKPRSLRVCALLDKAERRKLDVPLDYVGFTIPNRYVVGYGLDYQDRYRNLPYIAVLDVEEP
ncbi:MAG: hypoxanthine phosphoribosyltransferase [Nitrospirae bacterium]|nr:hypoxanthine phosphoribosyltransferase [Nitrospirota bacterium]